MAAKVPTPTEVLAALPHRAPFRFIDEILELDDDHIVAAHRFPADADFYRGHFPGAPITPGVLLVESMAQVGGLLMMEENFENKVIYFMTLNEIKFRRPVVPGDQLRFEVEIVQLKKHTCRMKGTGSVDGQVVVEVGEMMARIVDA